MWGGFILEKFDIYDYDDNYLYLNFLEIEDFVFFMNNAMSDNLEENKEIVTILSLLFFSYNDDSLGEYMSVTYDKDSNILIFAVTDDDDNVLYIGSDLYDAEDEGILKHAAEEYIFKINRDIIPEKWLNLKKNYTAICYNNMAIVTDDSMETIDAVDFGMRILKEGDGLSLIKDDSFITCEMVDKDFAKVVVETRNLSSVVSGDVCFNTDKDIEKYILITLEDKIKNTLIYGDGETKKTYYISNNDLGYSGLMQLMNSPDGFNSTKSVINKIFKNITKKVKVMKERKYINEEKRHDIEK